MELFTGLKVSAPGSLLARGPRVAYPLLYPLVHDI